MPFSIVRDDITRVKADAIVNAANEMLQRGGGVCGAIFAAAGARKLQQACNKIGHCDTGSAVATPAFDLHARYVIHAVGPIWRDGRHRERELLASCYRSSLQLAASLRCTSIAFPLISAGIYGYPKHEALEVAQGEILRFLETHEMNVTLVLYDSGAGRLADDLRLRVERYIDDVYVGAHATPRRARERELQQQLAAAAAWEAQHKAEPEDATYESAAWSEDAAYESEPWPEDLIYPSSTEPAQTGAGPSTCPVCGAPIEASGPTYCVYCGHRLDGAETQEHYDEAERLSSIPDPIHYSGTMASMPAPVDGAASAPAIGAPLASSHGAPSAPRGASNRRRIRLPHPLRNLLAHLDAGFSDTLMTMIDERGLKDSEVYKRANISRQHFSKIRSNPHYQPKKNTVLALAVALELSPEETSLLLERAGFAFSHADQRDVIVEFFIKEGIYDVFQINDALFAFDQPLLG